MSLPPDQSPIALCATADVPAGQMRRVEAAGLTLAVFNIEGTFFVTDDHCTHGPGSLSNGWLDGFEVECDFHQGRFDVRTGEVKEPPPMIPIRTYPVTVRDDVVVIEAD